MGLTLNNLPETLGVQLRAGPRPRSQAGPWVMVHREEGASEHGAEAESATCGWIPAGTCQLKQKHQHSPWDLNKTQDLITHSIKMSTIQSKISQHTQNQENTTSEDKTGEDQGDAGVAVL